MSFVIIKKGRLLDQRLIALVLMMINSCSYSTNDLVFIYSQIFDQDLSRCLASTKDSTSSLELPRVDSRTRTSRLHQVLKRSLAHWIKVWTSQEGEEDLQEKTFKKTCVGFCKC